MSSKLKVLGLALIVVCAFGAVTAVAQAAPKFTVSGITSGKEAITEEATPNGVMTLTVPGKMRITCTTLTIKNGTITVGTDENAAEALDFGGCTVDQSNGTALPKCSVHDNLANPVDGTIRTNALTSTLVNIGEEGYVTFKAASGNFVNIVVTGETCPVAGTYPVAGSVNTTIESPAAGVLATTVSLTSSQAIQEKGGDKLTVGTVESFLDGTVSLRLVSDRNWGYDL
jgi:hypothetical protein